MRNNPEFFLFPSKKSGFSLFYILVAGVDILKTSTKIKTPLFPFQLEIITLLHSIVSY